MLSDTDRGRVESVPFDPAARPAFDELGGFLAWPDEIPAGLTSAGHEYVRDLLIARGHIHRHIDADGWRPPEVLARWRDARGRELRWNGFRRVVLSAEDEAFLTECLADDEPV